MLASPHLCPCLLFHTPSPLAPDLGRRTTLRAWTLVLALVAGAVVVGLTMAGLLSPRAGGGGRAGAGGGDGPGVGHGHAPDQGGAGRARGRLAHGHPSGRGPGGTGRRPARPGADDQRPGPRRLCRPPHPVSPTGAARELLRLPPESALLVAAVRNPEVLEVIDEALFGGIEGEAEYEAGGVQERYWRAVTKPLSPRTRRRAPGAAGPARRDRRAPQRTHARRFPGQRQP
ncbi:MAG: hypothetical protein WDN45_11445 [Caulobacteraceae bacterium]